MTRVNIEFDDLTPDKQQEIIEAYEAEGHSIGDIEELFYCIWTVDDESETTYE